MRRGWRIFRLLLVIAVGALLAALVGLLQRLSQHDRMALRQRLVSLVKTRRRLATSPVAIRNSAARGRNSPILGCPVRSIIPSAVHASSAPAG